MLLSVSGATSRAGKTAAAVSLLRAVPGATAVKFTTTDDTFTGCPRGTPCVVCDIDVPFRLIEDPLVLRQPGTDTDRFAAAGARRVVWAITKPIAAAAAWEAVRARFAEAPVVMDGSRVVALARPDFTVFVAHPFLPPERWKPTSAALIASADLVVVNRRSDERRQPSPSVLGALARHRQGRTARIADVTLPISEWAPEILARLLAAPSNAQVG